MNVVAKLTPYHAYRIVSTTARAYGVQQPQQPCMRCKTRMSDSDILLGYCQHCTDALAARASKDQAGAANKPFFPTTKRR